MKWILFDTWSGDFTSNIVCLMWLHINIIYRPTVIVISKLTQFTWISPNISPSLPQYISDVYINDKQQSEMMQAATSESRCFYSESINQTFIYWQNMQQKNEFEAESGSDSVEDLSWFLEHKQISHRSNITS